MVCDAKSRLSEQAFGDAIFDLVRRTACELPEDVEAALKRAHDEETSGSTARMILATFLENIALAKENQVPLCQDTGMPL
ncbi:MAG: fumarate hydratase, partial [Syntrophales bacterium]|nr:fumarate hydratase [Syntrophales bacterium]